MQDVYWGTMFRFTPTYGGRERSSDGHREKLGYAVVPTEASANPMGNDTTKTTLLSFPELEGGVLAFTSSCWIGVAPGKGLCSWIGQFFSEERW